VSKGVGDSPGPCACRGLACLTPVLVCIGIGFSPHIVAVVCLICVLLSETDNDEEGIEKVFNKSLWRENNIFLNAFHKMLFDSRLIVFCLATLSLLLMFLNNWKLPTLGFTDEKREICMNWVNQF
jgi:hypothetical protein